MQLTAAGELAAVRFVVGGASRALSSPALDAKRRGGGSFKAYRRWT